MKDVLTVEGLNFNYCAKTTLDNFSLSVPAGTFCALLGPNGAGKSTLFLLLCRLLVARSGRIHLGGHDLSAAPGRALSQVGIVFQQSTLDLDLTVERNLLYAAALQRLSGAEARHRMDGALDRLGILDSRRRKVRDMNQGHRRRAEIARALMHDPKLLLLDEPTVGLDAAARRSITQYVHDLTERGVGVLWATHLVDEITDRDRLVILHHGKTLAHGNAGELRGDTPLLNLFFQMTAQMAVEG